MKYVLCRKASNLGVESMSCFIYCLGNLELALLVVANAIDSNSSTEITEHAVISFTNNSLEGFDLFA